jgi:hypothetical protein
MKILIIYSEISWDFLDQRHHHLARYAVKNGFKVEFVQRVVSRVPNFKDLYSITKKFFFSKNNLQKHKDVPPQLILRKSIFLPPTLFFSGIYNWLVWFFYERYRQKNAIVYSFVNNPHLIGGRFPIYAKYRIAAFDVIHNWWEFLWQKDQHKKIITKSLDCYQKLITDSPEIVKRIERNGFEPHLMLPGIERGWIDISSKESYLKPVFYGNLRSNSDLNLINKFIKEYDMHLIGLIDDTVINDLESYKYLGKKNKEELLICMKTYNIIILPYNNDEFSKTISPAKYFEALATGSLVVTCADMSHLPGFKDFVVRIDLNSQNFSKNIEEAFFQHILKRDAQVKFASSHLWNERFKDLFIYLEKN